MCKILGRYLKISFTGGNTDMRIFSRKAFQFDHPAGADTPVVVQMNSFSDVPDWVTDSALYKLAAEGEDVLVINSPQDEIEAEISSPDLSKRQKAAAARAQKKAEADAAAAAATPGADTNTTPQQ
jgi:hypothetical protein